MSLTPESIQQTFLTEGEELVGLAERCAWTSAPDEQAVSELIRCVHGLKGAAASVGFGDFADFAAALETQCRRMGSHGDDALRERVLDALAFLQQWLGALRAAQAPGVARIRAQRARLERGNDAAPPAGDRLSPAVQPAASTAARHLRIVYATGRMLIGAELIQEHVLETLAQAGRVLSVQPPDAETGDRQWQLECETPLDDRALNALFDQLAEPGSLKVEEVEPERVCPEPEPASAQTQVQEQAYVTVRLGQHWFAVEGRAVHSALSPGECLTLPGAGMAVVLDDQLLPLVVPVRLPELEIQMQAEAATVSTVLVLRAQSGLFGLLCDELGELLPGENDDLKRLGRAATLHQARFIDGALRLEDGWLPVLAPDELLALHADGEGLQETMAQRSVEEAVGRVLPECIAQLEALGNRLEAPAQQAGPDLLAGMGGVLARMGALVVNARLAPSDGAQLSVHALATRISAELACLRGLLHPLEQSLHEASDEWLRAGAALRASLARLVGLLDTVDSCARPEQGVLPRSERFSVRETARSATIAADAQKAARSSRGKSRPQARGRAGHPGRSLENEWNAQDP
ncbi:MAG: Hpt domain-containing protein [Rhodocyclaceae bacterium]|jgi:HPt (histidine-containing phosphotransfer) domain-containing protein/chemotaxis signal transduction protein|nr:Hpt domain-containing protein [Rhodocyclaceae bacterium]